MEKKKRETDIFLKSAVICSCKPINLQNKRDLSFMEGQWNRSPALLASWEWTEWILPRRAWLARIQLALWRDNKCCDKEMTTLSVHLQLVPTRGQRSSSADGDYLAALLSEHSYLQQREKNRHSEGKNTTIQQVRTFLKLWWNSRVIMPKDGFVFFGIQVDCFGCFPRQLKNVSLSF